MPDFVEGNHKNDCLDVVSKLYPLVKGALQELNEFSEARLTGTGACVFAEFDSYEDAAQAYQKLKDKWVAYLAKGVNRSPLFEKFDSVNLTL
jgi:4-diphosphocytidyl-2-C-methyl-D-erythritol kinase